MTNMVDLASRLAGFGPAGPVRAGLVCDNCGKENPVEAKACVRCRFPLGKDADDYAVCERCDKWTLFMTMNEHPDGWYCQECHEEAGAEEIDRARDEAKEDDPDRRHDEAVDRELEGRG